MQPLMKYSTLISINFCVNNPDISGFYGQLGLGQQQCLLQIYPAVSATNQLQKMGKKMCIL